MPRAGPNEAIVVEEAERLVDELGLPCLTMAGLAGRLGVRQPSLYKHVENLDGLRRSLAVRAKRQLADALGHASVGWSERDAILSVSQVYRAWAHEHPGRYVAAQRAPQSGDAEDEAASAAVVGVVFDILAGYGLDGDDAVDAARALRSALHGFVSLEAAGGFSLPSPSGKASTASWARSRRLFSSGRGGTRRRREPGGRNHGERENRDGGEPVNGPGSARLRSAIGRVGVWASSRAIDEDAAGFARLVERLGFGALWVGGSNVDDKAFEVLGRALQATRRLVVATGITNIWAWQPEVLARRVTDLETAFPGRFLLGLGVSHAPQVEQLGQHYERPFEAMSGFLTALEYAWAGQGGGSAKAPPARVLAALGPRMLELSRDRSEGAHPYLTPPEHTVFARRVLGEGPLLAPEQAFVLESEQSQARAAARADLARYLRLPNYRTNLERLGYGGDDFAAGGSDRLVDGLVAHGSGEVVAGHVRAHLEAGADHVCVQPLALSGGLEAGALERLAPLLRGI